MMSSDERQRALAIARMVEQSPDALLGWLALGRHPADLVELPLAAFVLADAGNEQAILYTRELGKTEKAEALAIEARLRIRQRRYQEAADLLHACFAESRSDPWATAKVMTDALKSAELLASEAGPAVARSVFDSLAEPFSVMLLDEKRKFTRLTVAEFADERACKGATLAALKAFEPHVPWHLRLLRKRAECYRSASDSLADPAAADLTLYLRSEGIDEEGTLAGSHEQTPTPKR